VFSQCFWEWRHEKLETFTINALKTAMGPASSNLEFEQRALPKPKISKFNQKDKNPEKPAEPKLQSKAGDDNWGMPADSCEDDVDRFKMPEDSTVPKPPHKHRKVINKADNVKLEYWKGKNVLEPGLELGEGDSSVTPKVYSLKIPAGGQGPDPRFKPGNSRIEEVYQPGDVIDSEVDRFVLGTKDGNDKLARHARVSRPEGDPEIPDTIKADPKSVNYKQYTIEYSSGDPGQELKTTQGDLRPANGKPMELKTKSTDDHKVYSMDD
jgi:hypothetical protein